MLNVKKLLTRILSGNQYIDVTEQITWYNSWPYKRAYFNPMTKHLIINGTAVDVPNQSSILTLPATLGQLTEERVGVGVPNSNANVELIPVSTSTIKASYSINATYTLCLHIDTILGN